MEFVMVLYFSLFMLIIVLLDFSKIHGQCLFLS